MARAETIETVGENGGGRNGPLSCNACRAEPLPPLPTRPGALAAILQNSPNHVDPPQAPRLSNQLLRPQPEGRGDAHTHLQPPALSPTLSCRPASNERSRRRASAVSDEPDSNRAEQQDASSCQGPLPDLLPQNEQPPWASPPRQRGLGGEATQQEEQRRIANQLRIIGDEFNSAILRRAHVAPQRQDWRDVCRGFLNFIAQTLSTLYRLT